MARLLLCCENYAPSVGGVQEVIRQIAERSVTAGHEVTVATTTHPERAMDCIMNGVRVLSFAMSGNLVRGLSGDVDGYRRFLLDASYDVLLIKAAQQSTFDAAIDVIDRIAARKIFIPCGFSGLRRPEFATYYADMPAWLARFDRLLFYANRYQDIEFAKGAALENLTVVPNGVDEAEFFGTGCAEGQPSDHREFVVLSVGSRIVAKGHWEALESFATARITGPARLILNGKVPVRSRYRSFAGGLRDLARGYPPLRYCVAAANLRFALTRSRKRAVLVDLDRAALLAAYRQADIFLFASHVEYSPLVLFEAAASGTPFVTTDVGNATEIAQWTGGGIVAIPPAPVAGRNVTVARLAEALESLAQQPERVALMARAGRRSVEKTFCWRSIVRRYWQAMAIDAGPQQEGATRAFEAAHLGALERYQGD